MPNCRPVAHIHGGVVLFHLLTRRQQSQLQVLRIRLNFDKNNSWGFKSLVQQADICIFFISPFFPPKPAVLIVTSLIVVMSVTQSVFCLPHSLHFLLFFHYLLIPFKFSSSKFLRRVKSRNKDFSQSP